MIALGMSLKARKEEEGPEGQTQKSRTMKTSLKQFYTMSTMMVERVAVMHLQRLYEQAHLIPTLAIIIPRSRTTERT